MRRSLSSKSMSSSFVILLSLIPATSWSSPISVGGTTMEIPNPPYSTPVTPYMGDFRFQQQFVSPMNERFALYIPGSEIIKSIEKKTHGVRRTFSVQTAKSVIYRSISKSDFLEFKESLKTQNEVSIAKVKALLAEQVESVTKGIAEQYGVAPALSVSEIVPLPSHEETDRTWAYSQFVKCGGRDEAGNLTSNVGVVTTTFVHVKNKVLFLYSTAEESGLEWSRTVSKQWADSIVAANPPVVMGLDWGKTVGKGIASGIVVSIICLIGWIRHRSNTEVVVRREKDHLNSDTGLGNNSVGRDSPY